MTEAEWAVCVDPRRMLQFLHSKGSKRIWRLFAVACVRRVEPLMRDPRSRLAVEVAERFADGEATGEELNAAHEQAEAAAHQAHYEAYMDEARARFRWDATYEAFYIAAQAADAAVQCAAADISEANGGPTVVIAESLQLPDLLREVFGNPFRWITIDAAWPAWNDGAIPKMAQGIYDGRAFGRLQLLADALEEAGCDNADILSHCRSGGEHVRGCWVVDLLLGKS